MGSEQEVRRPTPSRSRKKFALLVLLSLIQIGCNVGILYASKHTYRFGARITKETWWISDNRLISVVEPFSKLLHTITALVGGWTISLLWSRRLSQPESTAGLAELQSFSIFESIPTILSSLGHIFHHHYLSAQWLYAAVISCAILFQLYSTAIITLITPSITLVNHPVATYPYTSQEFMSSPGFGYRCQSSSADPNLVRTCLEVTLSGTASIDAETLNGNKSWGNTGPNSLWIEIRTSYMTPYFLAGVAVPLGPYNNRDLSEGAMIYGVNMATVERLADPYSRIWDSLQFALTVTTALPVLTCQCVRQDPGSTTITSITIQGFTYQLPNGVPQLQAGQIIAQVTPDNLTLILSIPPSPGQSGNKHCAINFEFQSADLSLIGTNVQDLYVPDTLLVYPFGNPWDQRDFANSHRTDRQSMHDFADYWLAGLGWSGNVSQSALVDHFSALPIGTGELGAYSDVVPLEYYLLAMLLNGISAGFSPEETPDSSSDVASIGQRTFVYNKAEYYLGVTSRWQYFYVAIIILNTCFIAFCLMTILRYGWYPDWTDPVTIAQAMLCSDPSSESVHPSKSITLERSPLPLVNGKDADEKLWREEFSLVEVVSSDRQFLAFERKGPVEASE
ncbi:hypothetical protein NLI96_g4407 [Meripilus lineatus]|uniref:Uncharacterized protein n=1 Tax=Meripilus lineatus TaxID=2056292 RepID=A0AAD5V760_9APHY|nr:hypothetical protein NLI96_g4407 [Physisporinus lineatus]